LHHKKVVKFHAHPSKSNPEKYPAFELVLSSKISYDTLAQKAAEQLKVPPTHIRFFTVNAATGNPKVPVKRGATQNLQSILNPTGFTQMNAQRSDAFYFEVLDIPLSELDTKKAIKVNLLSEGITKEVRSARQTQATKGKLTHYARKLSMFSWPRTATLVT
jgi:ubiquitin carboxyl-terminal hydrolase 7